MVDSQSSTMVDSSFVKITLVTFNHLVSMKLNNENHLIWKQQIIATVCGHNVMHFLDESKPVPAQFLSEQDKRNGKVNLEFSAWK